MSTDRRLLSLFLYLCFASVVRQSASIPVEAKAKSPAEQRSGRALVEQSASFQLLRRNVENILDNLSNDLVTPAQRGNLHEEFKKMFDEYESKSFDELEPTMGKVKRLPYGQIHRLAHTTIDNMDLSPEALHDVHRAIHYAFTSSYASNVCYPQFSEQHTGCLAKQGRTGCPKVTSGVQQDEMTLIVDRHNAYRSEVARGEVVVNNTRLPTAASMYKMKWDEELARLAQAWADQCNFTNDCADCRRTDRLRFIGQNVLRFKGLKDSQQSPRWQMALAAWAGGRRNILIGDDVLTSYFHDNAWASYTQIIWDYTYLLGCGFSYYKDEELGDYTQLYVCNYGAAGNVLGTKVYNMGDTCSKCPKSHDCEEDTKLCSYGEGEKAPAGFVASDIGAESEGAGAPHEHGHDHGEETEDNIDMGEVESTSID